MAASARHRAAMRGRQGTASAAVPVRAARPAAMPSQSESWVPPTRKLPSRMSAAADAALDGDGADGRGGAVVPVVAAGAEDEVATRGSSPPRCSPARRGPCPSCGTSKETNLIAFGASRAPAEEVGDDGLSDLTCGPI